MWKDFFTVQAKHKAFHRHSKARGMHGSEQTQHGFKCFKTSSSQVMQFLRASLSAFKCSLVGGATAQAA